MILSDAHRRLFAEYLNWIAHKEMALGEMRPELWARAIAESRGHEGMARGVYLERRAQSLREEASVAQDFLRLLQQRERGTRQTRDAMVFRIVAPFGSRPESSG
jgi:hypothetical protein